MSDCKKLILGSLGVRIFLYIAIAIVAYLIIQYSSATKQGFVRSYVNQYQVSAVQSKPSETAFYFQLAKQAEKRLNANVQYDPSYYQINYPMGDVPADRGVCTDVIIRAYRGVGIDLQQLVHNDMSENFWSYPKIWRMTKPDTNIDHRRVPNLMTFFDRSDSAMTISDNSDDYHPGDVVAWSLGGGITHIGLVSTGKSERTGYPLIVHNIGQGPRLEDMIFAYEIIGHYRFGARVGRNN